MTREERVLAYVNRQRAKLGRRPLKRLPKGYREEADSCPIAKALPAPKPGWTEVDATMVVVMGEWGSEPKIKVKPPQYVAAFIRSFDEGEFPHLELKRR